MTAPGPPPHTLAAVETPRIEYLDSVRGLAALIVVVGHVAGSYGLPGGWEARFHQTPLRLLWDGYAAVSMFFVLSGLVLSKKYFRRPSGQSASAPDLLPFFCARISRIYVPFVVAIGISAVAQASLWHPMETVPPSSQWWQAFWHRPMDVAEFLRQIGFALPRDEDRLMPQSWTLSIELKYSFLVPFLILCAHRGVFWVLALVGLLFAAFGMQVYALHFGFGVVLARWFETITSNRRSFSKLVVGSGGLLAFLFYAGGAMVACLSPNLLPRELAAAVIGVGAMLLLAALAASDSAQRILNIGVLRFLGRISYSTYLLHFVVLMVVPPPLLTFLNGLGWKDIALLQWIVLVSVVGVTIAISVVMFYFVEVPSIIAGRWFAGVMGRLKLGAKTRILGGPISDQKTPDSGHN